jgi:hypothetical protein
MRARLQEIVRPRAALCANAPLLAVTFACGVAWAALVTDARHDALRHSGAGAKLLYYALGGVTGLVITFLFAPAFLNSSRRKFYFLPFATLSVAAIVWTGLQGLWLVSIGWNLSGSDLFNDLTIHLLGALLSLLAPVFYVAAYLTQSIVRLLLVLRRNAVARTVV